MTQAMEISPKNPETVLAEFRKSINEGRPVDHDLALEIFRDDIPVERILEVASIARERSFGRGVRIHILNNVQNGSCSEDCGYCAQRNDTGEERISSYTMKSRDEILAEADDAARMGAFRYCLVLSGHGPSVQNIDFFTDIVTVLKERHPSLEICLSAGVLTDPTEAEKLKAAGLDRYNHNLNTSIAHYDQICSTHDFNERMSTIQNLHSVGVELCSGVIVGLGESNRDLVDVALTLRKNGVASIPVNFFLPIPDHAIENPGNITADFALRVLALFRLINPDAEIRAAAGREAYLNDHHHLALQAANSLFVSGYLNVKGSNLLETLEKIYESGYEIDLRHSELPGELDSALKEFRSKFPNDDPLRTPDFPGTGQHSSADKENFARLSLKDIGDLRPHRK